MPRKKLSNDPDLTDLQRETLKASEYIKTQCSEALSKKLPKDPLISDFDKSEFTNGGKLNKHDYNADSSNDDIDLRECFKKHLEQQKSLQGESSQNGSSSVIDNEDSSVDGMRDKDCTTKSESGVEPSDNSSQKMELIDLESEESQSRRGDEVYDLISGMGGGEIEKEEPEEEDDEDSDYDPFTPDGVKLSRIYKTSEYRDEDSSLLDEFYSEEQEEASSSISSQHVDSSSLDDGDSDPVSDSEDLEIERITKPSKPGSNFLTTGKRKGSEFCADLNLTPRQVETLVARKIEELERQRRESLSSSLACKQRRQKYQHKPMFEELFDCVHSIFYFHHVLICKQRYNEMLSSYLCDNRSKSSPNFELICDGEPLSFYDLNPKHQKLYSKKSLWLTEIQRQINNLFLQRFPECLAKDFICRMLLPGKLRYFEMEQEEIITKYPCPILGPGNQVDTQVIFYEDGGDEISLNINLNASVVLNNIFELFHVFERISGLFASQYLRISRELPSKKFSTTKALFQKLAQQRSNNTNSEEAKRFAESRNRILQNKYEGLENWKQLNRAVLMNNEYDRFYTLLTRTYSLIPPPTLTSSTDVTAPTQSKNKNILGSVGKNNKNTS